MQGQAWQTMRSYRTDRSIVETKLAPGTLRRILRFASGYRRLLLGLLLLVVLDQVIATTLPLIYRAIIDKGVLHHDGRLITALALLVAGLAVLDAVQSLAQRFFSSSIGEGLIYDMRSQVFAQIQRQPLAFFTRTQTGALISRLNNDVLGAQSAFTNTLSSVLSNVLGVSLTLIVMFRLSWQVTLLSLVLLPIFVLPARLLGRRLQAITRESYALNAQMNITMNERFNVSGALLVKLFGRPREEDDEFRGRASRVRDIGITQAMYGRIFFAALTLTAALGLAITYGVGGHLALSGHLTVGTLTALTAYLGGLYGPLTSLSNVRVDVMTALVAFERVFEVLDLDPEIRDRPGAVELPATTAPSLEFDHVTFRYPAASEVSLASLESVAVLDTTIPATVLHDLSFRAEPGELIALVGPSGAGKTTISQLVTRMYDAQGGAVRIGGIDVKELTLQSLRDTVGVVTQDAHMWHDTIRANLAYAAPAATESDLWRAISAAHVADLVHDLPDGLDTVVGDRGYRLSGGEKQRLAIARLLLKAPRIVVLDEATAHLDSESEVFVQRALNQALAGRTALVIAHRLSTVRDADRILVIDGGRVIESGRHEELLARHGAYAELYQTQFAGQEQLPPVPVA